MKSPYLLAFGLAVTAVGVWNLVVLLSLPVDYPKAEPPLHTAVEGFGSFNPEDVMNKKPFESHQQADDGRVLSGVSSGSGYAIEWEGLGSQSSGASPVDVLKAAANRMSFLQTTPEGSDKNARALFEVIEAIDALEGTAEVSAPVGPGFTGLGNATPDSGE